MLSDVALMEMVDRAEEWIVSGDDADWARWETMRPAASVAWCCTLANDVMRLVEECRRYQRALNHCLPHEFMGLRQVSHEYDDPVLEAEARAACPRCRCDALRAL